MDIHCFKNVCLFKKWKPNLNRQNLYIYFMKENYFFVGKPKLFYDYL